MFGYIYKVTNLINGKIYIGQTIQTVKNRWYRHCGKSGISKEEMNTHFKRALLKYGKENFKVETLEKCDPTELDEKEKYYIAYYNSYKEGYNSTLGGKLGAKPFKSTEEQNLKIKEEYLKGRSLTHIGKLFKLDKATVKGILIRQNVRLRSTKTYKWCQEQRQEILDKINKGATRESIQQEYKISKSYLSQLITGKRRI